MKIDYQWLINKGVCNESISLTLINYQDRCVNVEEVFSDMLDKLEEKDQNEWFMIFYHKLLEEASDKDVVGVLKNQVFMYRTKHLIMENIINVCDVYLDKGYVDPQTLNQLGKDVLLALNESREAYGRHEDVMSNEARSDYADINFYRALNDLVKALRMSRNKSEMCRHASKVVYYIVKFENGLGNISSRDVIQEKWGKAFSDLLEKIGSEG